MSVKHLEEFMNDLFYFSAWSGKYSWEDVGYNPDPKLLKDYEKWYIEIDSRITELQKIRDKHDRKKEEIKINQCLPLNVRRKIRF